MSKESFKKVLSLVTESRLRESTLGSRGILVASESDKGRIINSASFRRLQQKAQVFPLEDNAAVRTRLTHSIEVSQIGRYLAQRVIELLADGAGEYNQLAAFVNTVESACLLHDIGNPPFGHLGESAIKEWFKKRPSKIDDLCNFDGNPQGFRFVSFLGGSDNSGLNLTSTLLLSIIKYPWTTESCPPGKKIGFFASDKIAYEKACNQLNWQPGKKFPFAVLMDAADEIAYSMSDLEDGLEKSILSEEDLKKEFGNDSLPNGVIKPFVAFKTKTINLAAKEAANKFVSSLDEILSGEPVDLIGSNSEAGELLNKVGKIARERIYCHKAAEQVELAGRSVIKGLLNHFGELLELPEDDFLNIVNKDSKETRKKGLEFQARLYNRLPNSYCEKYQESTRESEPDRRAHLIVDFISGMTDDFALETYQILEGIRVK